MNPRNLPVYQQREKILSSLRDHQVVVVESPTGSGKTTQLPVILHEAGFESRGVIGITQPRRIAAVSVSDYIRKQLHQELGEQAQAFCGYKMRFHDTTTGDTRIKVMTDGILLQELKADPYLSRYSVIMVDEAHERSLNIDFILGLLKRSLELRPDLKLIISSATINADIFSDYFASAPVVRIDTETFPVSTIYAPPAVQGDYEVLVQKIVEIVGHVIDEKRPGDMLIFLSGERIIKDTITALYSQPFRKKLYILPLYGRLSKEEQDEVFPPPPPGKIKLVVATNIAETSITIDGITTVIDSGLAKMNFYNPRTFTSSLVEKPISKASANQRRGRAGRTRPGTCYRLYPMEDFQYRPEFTQEEIFRTDLSEVVLRMAELGIRDFESFDFISPPGRGGIASAVETLNLLDALDDERSLSRIGQRMARFPLLPRHSRMIVEAMLSYPDVLDHVVTATSFLTTNNPFLLPQGEESEARNAHHHFRDEAGDFVSYLKMLRSYLDSRNKEKFCQRYYLDEQIMAEIANVKDQLGEIVGEMGMPVPSPPFPLKGEMLASYLCAVSTGLVQFICVRTGRSSYKSFTADRIEIHPGSVMFRETPDIMVAGEIVKTSRTFARSVSPLKAEWLKRISPEISGILARQLDKNSGGGKKGKKNKELARRLETGTKASRGKTTSGATGRRKIRTTDASDPWSQSSAEPPAYAGPSRGSGSQGTAKDQVSPNGMEVRIGGQIFPLKPFKGKKKILELSWRELSSLAHRDDLELIPPHRDLRVMVHYRKYIFLKQERLGNALGIARVLSPETHFREHWPKTAKVSPWELPEEVSSLLNYLPGISPVKKNDRELGFITLYTDNQGLYWLKSVKNFSISMSDSIASLDSLFDDLAALEAVRSQGGGDTLPPGIPELKELSGSLYRRFSQLLDEL
ncbi:helicase-related protein [Salinispira pacifica]|uniref:RNA helicase n=1 Tax=Salinispira pacifica TaxID=1307761 RepID=V5WGD9_9SPIO|nr:ATP-dependent RNA helicase [Salinispira pacifica]AHC14231.1 ATP-dependent helicase HrpA, putative [Salinispira pacifica]